jgi:hypothetical protein
VAAGPTRFTDVDAGTQHTCAVAEGGAAYCWGQDLYGALGDGPPVLPNPTAEDLILLAPTRVAGGHTWRAVRAGAEATCGVTTEGRAYCWGNNQNGTLGVGTKGWFGGAFPRSIRWAPAAVVAP